MAPILTCLFLLQGFVYLCFSLPEIGKFADVPKTIKEAGDKGESELELFIGLNEVATEIVLPPWISLTQDGRLLKFTAVPTQYNATGLTTPSGAAEGVVIFEVRLKGYALETQPRYMYGLTLKSGPKFALIRAGVLKNTFNEVFTDHDYETYKRTNEEVKATVVETVTWYEGTDACLMYIQTALTNKLTREIKGVDELKDFKDAGFTFEALGRTTWIQQEKPDTTMFCGVIKIYKNKAEQELEKPYMAFMSSFEKGRRGKKSPIVPRHGCTGAQLSPEFSVDLAGAKESIYDLIRSINNPPSDDEISTMDDSEIPPCDTYSTQEKGK